MAQVDTGIYQNLLRPPKSVQEFDQEAQQAEGNKLGLLLQRGQYDAQQRGVAEDNAFRNALSSGADDKALMAASPTRALAFQEGRAKIAKEQALTTKATSDAKKTDWEAAVAKQAHIAQLASSATDQASWTQARKIAQALGADVSQVPEQFDPATAKQFGSMAMTQAQRLDQAHKEAVLSETTRNNKAQNGIAMRGQDITMRGQNMTDSRARESIAQGKAPSGYRQRPDGSLEFIPGGPADPAAAKKAAPTEFQGKSATFGSRAQEADRILQELDGKYSPAGISMKQGLGRAWGVGGVLESAANMGMSSSTQKAEQAQRDFVNAVLRQESGAAIGESEFDNASKQYFPQPGDSKAVIQQKAANRKRATQGLINNAGSATVTPPSSGGASGEWGGGWSITPVGQ